MGPIKDVYYVATNAHPEASNQMAAGTTVTGCLFESVSNNSANYIIYANSGAVTIKECFVLPAGDGFPSGWLVWAGTTGPITVEHSLQFGKFVAPNGMIDLGFYGVVLADQVASCRANIFFSATAVAGGESGLLIAERGASSTYTIDVVTVAGYNGYFRASTGTVRTGAGGVST